MITSFYSIGELKDLGLAKFGKNVLISKKASFYYPEKMSIGNNVRIDDFCILSGRIEIGNFIHIAAYSAIYAGDEGVLLEDFVGISGRVSIYTISDDYSGNSLTNPMVPDKYKTLDKGKVILKKHAIVGAGSVILPNVIIGEGTAVGALSLISKNLEPWSIYVGMPARKISERKKNLLKLEEKLLGEMESEKNN